MKLTKEHIEAQVAKKEFSKLGVKTTVCLLTLKNGFEIVGTSSCIDPANYDQAIGNRIAEENALNKVWELEGYKHHSAPVETAVDTEAPADPEKGTAYLWTGTSWGLKADSQPRFAPAPSGIRQD